MALRIFPTELHYANDFVANFHRHSKRVRGGRFALLAREGDREIGVAIVGRPVARLLQDGLTAEVLRVCVLDDAPKNACSFLYGRCWRVWQAMGGRRMVTYTLAKESGASLRGARWQIIGEGSGPRREGHGWQNRPGREFQPVYGQLKLRWQVEAA